MSIMMLTDPKKIAGTIPMKEDEGSEFYAEALKAAAEKILEAIKSSNISDLVDAMKNFHYVCDDEKEEEESEGEM